MNEPSLEGPAGVSAGCKPAPASPSLLGDAVVGRGHGAGDQKGWGTRGTGVAEPHALPQHTVPPGGGDGGDHGTASTAQHSTKDFSFR